MAKREKIILLVMIIVIAFGGYTYFFSSKTKTIIDDSNRNLSDLKDFVIGAATNLSNEYITLVFSMIVLLFIWYRNIRLKHMQDRDDITK